MEGGKLWYKLRIEYFFDEINAVNVKKPIEVINKWSYAKQSDTSRLVNNIIDNIDNQTIQRHRSKKIRWQNNQRDSRSRNPSSGEPGEPMGFVEYLLKEYTEELGN